MTAFAWWETPNGRPPPSTCAECGGAIPSLLHDISHDDDRPRCAMPACSAVAYTNHGHRAGHWCIRHYGMTARQREAERRGLGEATLTEADRAYYWRGRRGE